MADSPLTGHLCSQNPQPLHLDAIDHGPSIPLDRPKNNGIVRTDLIADQAQFVLSPDQAHLLAQNGRSDLGMGLFIQRQRTDRLGRTDLAADIAVRFARRHPQIQLRGPEAREAGFPETGLKGIGQAGFHAFPAADAGAQKFGFRKRSGRSDELMLALKRSKRGLEPTKSRGSALRPGSRKTLCGRDRCSEYSPPTEKEAGKEIAF